MQQPQRPAHRLRPPSLRFPGACGGASGEHAGGRGRQSCGRQKRKKYVHGHDREGYVRERRAGRGPHVAVGVVECCAREQHLACPAAATRASGSCNSSHVAVGVVECGCRQEQQHQHPRARQQVLTLLTLRTLRASLRRTSTNVQILSRSSIRNEHTQAILTPFDTCEHYQHTSAYVSIRKQY